MDHFARIEYVPGNFSLYYEVPPVGQSENLVMRLAHKALPIFVYIFQSSVTRTRHRYAIKIVVDETATAHVFPINTNMNWDHNTYHCFTYNPLGWYFVNQLQSDCMAALVKCIQKW